MRRVPAGFYRGHYGAMLPVSEARSEQRLRQLLGLCERCGVGAKEGGTRWCEPCVRAEDWRRTEKLYDYFIRKGEDVSNETMKKLRQRLRAEGVCLQCHSEAAVTGAVTGQKCRDRHKQIYEHGGGREAAAARYRVKNPLKPKPVKMQEPVRAKVDPAIKIDRMMVLLAKLAKGRAA